MLRAEFQVSSSDDYINSLSLQAVFTVELALLELTNLAIHERNRKKAGTFILRFKFWLSVDRESRNIFLAFAIPSPLTTNVAQIAR